jgi:hypothetical protein
LRFADAPLSRTDHASHWRGWIIASLMVFAVLAGAAAWFLPQVPPRCDDAGTVAMVQNRLRGELGLPRGTTLDHIRTIAGGFLAVQFVCQADLVGFDRSTLPPGSVVPHTVEFTSRLHGTQHDVSVTLSPLLTWQRVE